MVRNRKITYIFSGVLVAISFVSLLLWGLAPSIDFTGGTVEEVHLKEKVAHIRRRKGEKGIPADEIRRHHEVDNQGIRAAA